MLIAGEASGDLHGALLVEELKKIEPGLIISGVGGDKMKAAGMELIYHIKSMSFLGFAEVIKHLPHIKKVRKTLIDYIIEKKITTVVLIDYPGFNLSIAKKLKALNVKLIYYISPQIWAWGAGRVKKIKKLITKMLVVFRFEADFYKNHNIDAEFVGHPLIDQISKYKLLDKKSFFERFNLDNDKKILLILAGSREHEVKEIFPECVNAALAIAKEFNMQVVVGRSPNIDEDAFELPGRNDEFKVIKDFTYELMSYSTFGIIKSGTSTLEAALFKLPMVVVYKTNFLTYLIGRLLVKVKNIGLVNIVYGKTLVPEIIQNDLTTDNIYNESKRFLSDKTLYEFTIAKLGEIKELLGSAGASAKAAQRIHLLMNDA
jgi:lipid-A-disaccharide synthase